MSKDCPLMRALSLLAQAQRYLYPSVGYPVLFPLPLPPYNLKWRRSPSRLLFQTSLGFWFKKQTGVEDTLRHYRFRLKELAPAFWHTTVDPKRASQRPLNFPLAAPAPRLLLPPRGTFLLPPHPTSAKGPLLATSLKAFYEVGFFFPLSGLKGPTRLMRSPQPVAHHRMRGGILRHVGRRRSAFLAVTKLAGRCPRPLTPLTPSRLNRRKLFSLKTFTRRLPFKLLRRHYYISKGRFLPFAAALTPPRVVRRSKYRRLTRKARVFGLSPMKRRVRWFFFRDVMQPFRRPFRRLPGTPPVKFRRYRRKFWHRRRFFKIRRFRAVKARRVVQPQVASPRVRRQRVAPHPLLAPSLSLSIRRAPSLRRRRQRPSPGWVSSPRVLWAPQAVALPSLLFQTAHTPTTLRKAQRGLFKRTLPQFKWNPGYMTFWRRHRRALAAKLGLAYRRQKQITSFVSQLWKLRGVQAWKLLTLNVSGLFLAAHPHLPQASLFYFLNGGGLFLNARVVKNPFLALSVGDVLAWKADAVEWAFTSLTARYWRHARWSGFNFLRRRDLPPYLEVDFLVCALTLLYEPWLTGQGSQLAPATLAHATIRLYNWKYVT